MIGLLKKDFYSIKKILLLYLVITIILVILSTLKADPALLVFVTIFFGGIACTTSIQYDEMSHWNSYALCLPVSRTTICISKYLFALLLLGYSCVVCLIFSLLTNNNGTSEFITNLKLFTSIVLVMHAIVLPISIRFGSAALRIIILPIWLIMFFGGNLLDFLKIPKPTEEQVMSAFTYAPYFSLALYLISLAICIGLVQKKEF